MVGNRARARYRALPRRPPEVSLPPTREHAKRFADDPYAFEEMLVEIGAATLCCQLNITSEPRPDHAQYVDHWL